MTDDQNQSKKQNQPSYVGSVGKEQEMGESGGQEILTEAGTVEMELPKEIKEIGGRVHKEVIELPPDVKKLGVSPTGPTAPVQSATTVVLPLSDPQIASGLQSQISSALRWLAVWCVRQLKKAHLTIKVVGGKMMRVTTK